MTTVTNLQGRRYLTRRLSRYRSLSLQSEIRLKTKKYYLNFIKNTKHPTLPSRRVSESSRLMLRWASRANVLSSVVRRLSNLTPFYFFLVAVFYKIANVPLGGCLSYCRLGSFHLQPSLPQTPFLHFHLNENILEFIRTGLGKYYSRFLFFSSARVKTLSNFYTNLPRRSLHSRRLFALIKSPRQRRRQRRGKKTSIISRLVYSRYYTFIEMSRANIRKGHTRPLYSQYFKRSFLHKRYLIILRAGTDSLPFTKSLTNSQRFLNNQGFSSYLNYHRDDNLTAPLYTSSTPSAALRPLNPLLLVNYYETQPLVLRLTTVTPCSKALPNTSLTTIANLGVLATNNTPQVFSYKPFLKFFFWGSYLSQTNFGVANPHVQSLLFKFNFEKKHFLNFRMGLPSRFNIAMVTKFSYTIRHKVVKVVVSSRYLPRTTSYFYHTLVNFIEFYTGKRVYLKFNPFIENALSYSDIARCHL